MSIPYVLEVGGQEVVLTPDPAHEFTATTEQVALGYGVSASTIRDHKANRPEELVEGKHWVVGVIDTPGGQQNLTLWTKRGIVRLGFFIRSARARLFRDMAEDLVLGQLEGAQEPGADALISARGIAEATGQDHRAALRLVQRYGGVPVAHYFEPLCRAPAYLFRISDIEAIYAQRGRQHRPFRPFTGEAMPGTAAVTRVVELARQSKAKRLPQSMPRLLDSAPVSDRVAAAQELVQLEQRRAYLLGVLA